MLFNNLLVILVLAGSTTAVFGPAPKPGSEPAPEPASHILNHDDVVLFNNEGSYSVVKDSHIQDLISKGEILPAPPPTRTMNIMPKRHFDGAGGKRDDCERSDEVQVLSEKQVLGWDVPMSPVVAALAATATANIGEGYSIQNFLTVAASVQGTYIIQATIGIQYARICQSTQTINFLFQVPTGNYGIIVSEPWTRLIQGNLISGCTDNPDVIPYTSHSYTSKSFGLLAWVDGLIRLCTSQNYPIPFCLGDGTHR